MLQQRAPQIPQIPQAIWSFQPALITHHQTGLAGWDHKHSPAQSEARDGAAHLGDSNDPLLPPGLRFLPESPPIIMHDGTTLANQTTAASLRCAPLKSLACQHRLRSSRRRRLQHVREARCRSEETVNHGASQPPSDAPRPRLLADQARGKRGGPLISCRARDGW